MSVYDSRNPRSGKVTPLVMGTYERPQGLSMAQTNAARKTTPLTPHHLRGGAFKQGGGVPVRTVVGTRSPFEFKRPGHGCYRTPGRKGPRGHCHAPANMVGFQGKIPNGEARNRRLLTVHGPRAERMAAVRDAIEARKAYQQSQAGAAQKLEPSRDAAEVLRIKRSGVACVA